MSGTITKKRIIRQFKTDNNVCAHCGGTFHYCQLDLHHPDESEKNPQLRNWDKSNRNLCRLPRKELDEELKKVQVLCKNCHALHHFNH